MRLLRDWKSEFGYLCPSPNLGRKLSLTLAFTVFGSVACISGVTLLVADNDPDPRSAFALAPLQPPSRQTAILAATAEMPAMDTVPARKVTTANGVKSCQRNASDDAGANCDTLAAQNPGAVHADLPAPAATPTPLSNGPTVGAPESAVLVASTPPLTEGTPEPMDAAPPPAVAEVPVPEASAAKPQKTVRHQSRRRYPYDTLSLWSFDHHYSRGGRQRFRTLW